MFSKIDKKILLILVAVILLLLLAGFLIYWYISIPATGAYNLTGGVQTENTSNNQNKPTTNTPQIQIQAGGVQVQGENGGGSLSVCLDKCGDGICQKTDPNCGKDNNLNCICPETPQECPQDCR